MKYLLVLLFLLPLSSAWALRECEESPQINQDKIIQNWHNCTGIYFSDKFGKYSGYFVNGQINGHGEIIYNYLDKLGDKYIGNFKEGVPDGYGTYYFMSNNIYKGEFKKGKPDGKGKYFYLSNKQ